MSSRNLEPGVQMRVFFEREQDDEEEEEAEEQLQSQNESNRTTFSDAAKKIRQMHIIVKIALVVSTVFMIAWTGIGGLAAIRIGLIRQLQVDFNPAYSNDSVSRNLTMHVLSSIAAIAFGIAAVILGLSESTPPVIERICKLIFMTAASISTLTGIVLARSWILPWRIGPVASIMASGWAVSAVVTGLVSAVFLVRKRWLSHRVWLIRSVLLFTGILLVLPVINYKEFHLVRDSIVLISQMSAVVATMEFIILITNKPTS